MKGTCVRSKVPTSILGLVVSSICYDDTRGEELGLMVLPKHTKMMVTNNNRMISMLLGFHNIHNVVKMVVGFNG
jgi:hypothetical protein